MSKIAGLTGHSNESTTDHDTAVSYIEQWQELAIVPASNGTLAHTNLAYGDSESHGKFKPFQATKPPSHAPMQASRRLAAARATTTIKPTRCLSPITGQLVFRATTLHRTRSMPRQPRR